MRLARFSGRVPGAVSGFRRPACAALVGLGLLMCRWAQASDPSSIYVVPTAVEQTSSLPSRAIIHGAFFRLLDADAFRYSDPQCGYMVFACREGEEAMCRMQWNDIASRITAAPTTCAGFGTFNVISAAAVRAEGTPLGTPDTWDLGIGIGTGSHVDGKCPLARALVCPLSSSVDAGAGTGGASGSGGRGSGGGGGGTPGLGGAANTGGAPASGGSSATGGSGSGGVTGARPDGGGQGGGGTGPGAKPSSGRSGCTLGGGAPASTAWSATLLALVAMTFARARRRAEGCGHGRPHG